MKTEDFLKIAVDSSRMGNWNDQLSYVTDAAAGRRGLKALSDEDLEMVAAGVDVNAELISKIKNSIFNN